MTGFDATWTADDAAQVAWEEYLTATCDAPADAEQDLIDIGHTIWTHHQEITAS